MKSPKCPRCKKKKHIIQVKDAAYVMKKSGKLKDIPGFYCEMCCAQWVMPEDLK